MTPIRFDPIELYEGPAQEDGGKESTRENGKQDAKKKTPSMINIPETKT